MRCPFCGAQDTKVIDSRLAGEGEQVRRRRQCTRCQERFTTYETVELTPPSVIKRNGSREPFDERKMRAGMLRALEKRPIETGQIEAAFNRIKRRLVARGEREVSSRQIGEGVLEELSTLDPVAYVRFASVYRQFEDVQAFRDEIDRLERRDSRERPDEETPPTSDANAHD